MTVTLELKPEIEARVRAKAAERGLPLEKFIETVIENNVSRSVETASHETATPEEWEATFDEFIQRNALRNVSWTVDDSRESIYREPEDAQM